MYMLPLGYIMSRTFLLPLFLMRPAFDVLQYSLTIPYIFPLLITLFEPNYLSTHWVSTFYPSTLDPILRSFLYSVISRDAFCDLSTPLWCVRARDGRDGSFCHILPW